MLQLKMPSLWRRVNLFVLALASVFSASNVKGQSNAEYNFRRQIVDNGDRFNTITDDAPILTMDCLAACSSAGLAMPTSFTGVTCSAPPASAHKSRPRALAMPDSLTPCQLLYNEGNSDNKNYMWQKSYDTLRKYIETCANDSRSIYAFVMMDQDVENIFPFDTVKGYELYRNWLKSILYLNTTNPEYFCAVVEAIAASFQATNKVLSVYQWLILNTNCDTADLRQYVTSRNSQYEDWLNTDTLRNKLDTTLSTMHDLGLDTLLARHSLMGVHNNASDLWSTIVSNFAVSDNPFDKNTAIRFTLNELSYVNVEVFDQLGKVVISEPAGRPYPAGPSELVIDAHALPSGTYYLRLSLASGAARTIKIIKKE